MDHITELENQSIYILREAYSQFKNLCMLWSIGKDSTVLLWLARKAFFGHVPFPLVHIDTAFKIPEMITYRDKLAAEWSLNMVVGQNKKSLTEKKSFPEGVIDRISCCRLLKTEALKQTLNGEGERLRFNHVHKKYEIDQNREPYTGVIVGVRSDEEGSRSKERYFSPRNQNNDWALGDQPPEFWNQFKTDFALGTHLRIHPLLDWTELNIWEYIAHEHIFQRYRSIMIKEKENVIAHWVAGLARRPLNRPLKMWMRLSKNLKQASLSTLRSVQGERRIKKMAVD